MKIHKKSIFKKKTNDSILKIFQNFIFQFFNFDF